MPPFIKRLFKVAEEKFATFGVARAEDHKPRSCQDFTSEKDPSGLPQVVDLRKYCTEVEDQKASNSCCANAVAGAYEYLCKKVAMETGDSVGDVSRLFIYFVGRKSDLDSCGRPNTRVKDEGMSIGGAINALLAKGAPLAASWPFDLDKVNQRPDDSCFEEAVNYKISAGLSVPVSLDQMKQCLAEGYPFIFGLKLTARFFKPGSTGRIATPNLDDPQSASHGLHAMLCVGYSEPEQVFIVRNSWGTSWGHEGYCYIPYDYMANSDFNFCGQYAIKGLTEYDLTPEDDGADHVLVDAEDDGEDTPECEEEEEDEVDDEDSDNEYDDMFNHKAEMRRVYDMFDRDGSDSMSSRELQRALRAMGVYLPTFALRGIMAAFNEDDDSNVSFEEFCNILQGLGIEI